MTNNNYYSLNFISNSIFDCSVLTLSPINNDNISIKSSFKLIETMDRERDSVYIGFKFETDAKQFSYTAFINKSKNMNKNNSVETQYCFPKDYDTRNTGQGKISYVSRKLLTELGYKSGDSAYVFIGTFTCNISDTTSNKKVWTGMKDKISNIFGFIVP
ncbi:MAG: hypothetical protein NT007_15440 [Candidatus Kapabacteria bacterium]|nr:hypothetical protein [Candidatus Kapabacteria bacterium]